MQQANVEFKSKMIDHLYYHHYTEKSDCFCTNFCKTASLVHINNVSHYHKYFYLLNNQQTYYPIRKTCSPVRSLHKCTGLQLFFFFCIPLRAVCYVFCQRNVFMSKISFIDINLCEISVCQDLCLGGKRIPCLYPSVVMRQLKGEMSHAI